VAREAPFKERTLRRLAIGSGRALHLLPGAAPRHRSVFLHMPKCGGTSLSEAMYATVPLSARIGVIDATSTRRAAALLRFGRDDARLCHEDLDHGQLVFDLREALLLQHMAWDTLLIHGHLFWSETAWTHFGGAYKFVTLLRDPVARTISNFRMAQRRGVIAGDLDSWLQGPVARQQARAYLRYLAGRNDISDNDVEAAVALAKTRLQHFALVGFLDRTDEFLHRYRALFGVRLRLPRLNAAPDRQPELSADQLRRLTTLCAPDIALFDHARSLSRA
jgi:hypothetical protein